MDWAAVISKALVCPYFGDLPEWMDHYWANADRLKWHGYDFLLDDDEEAFRDRVRDKLGIEPPPLYGTGRIWNFRPAFGVLYEEELKGYDFWGHTDFDCVYGQVEKWVTDEFLDGLDIHSNHVDYICGPWTLYRNSSVVNELFSATEEWKERMEGEDSTHGWAEKGFTRIVDICNTQGLIRRVYTMFQTANFDNFDNLRLMPDGRLMEGHTPRMMAHFRRTKTYPEGCKL